MPNVLQNLVRVGRVVQTFASHENRVFAILPGVPRVIPLRSSEFRDWLLTAYAAEHSGTPSPQAINTALDHLEARGAKGRKPVYIRIGTRVPAILPSSVLIDLNDQFGSAIDISAGRWQISRPDIPFELSTDAAELPQPVPCDDPRPALDRFRDSLNVATPADWHRCLGWLLSAFRPTGPYPILILQGPAGSGKTSAAHRIRNLVDPAASAIPVAPRKIRDLLGLANRHWVVAFDGVARFTPTILDAVCRFGSGLSLALHEDVHSRGREPGERTFNRPVIFTVADGWKCPPHLAHRALAVNLAPLDPDRRRTDTDLMDEFEQNRPETLGAFSTALSTAVAYNKQMLEPAAGPHCCDALAWAIAAVDALNCTREDLIAAFKPPDPPPGPRRPRRPRARAAPVPKGLLPRLLETLVPYRALALYLMPLIACLGVLAKSPVPDAARHMDAVRQAPLSTLAGPVSQPAAALSPHGQMPLFQQPVDRAPIFAPAIVLPPRARLPQQPALLRSAILLQESAPLASINQATLFQPVTALPPRVDAPFCQPAALPSLVRAPLISWTAAPLPNRSLLRESAPVAPLPIRSLLFDIKYITVGSMKRWIASASALLAFGCSRSNNLFLGRVEANVGSHRVIVTDCYRTKVPAPEQTAPSEYRFIPCRDADVHIRNEVLEVNGRQYGPMKPNDTVLVDHGVISLNPPE